MNSTQGHTGSALERFMGLDRPSSGDERERSVLAESATLGFTISIYVNLAVALIAAVLGALVLPAVLLLLTAIPSWVTSSHARHHQVDIDELAARENSPTRFWTFLTVFAGILLVASAMAWTVFTGTGLVVLPPVDAVGPDATGIWASLVKGAVVGALGGVVVGFFALLISQGRKARKAAAAPAEDDE